MEQHFRIFGRTGLSRSTIGENHRRHECFICTEFPVHADSRCLIITRRQDFIFDATGRGRSNNCSQSHAWYDLGLAGWSGHDGPCNHSIDVSQTHLDVRHLFLLRVTLCSQLCCSTITKILVLGDNHHLCITLGQNVWIGTVSSHADLKVVVGIV